MNTESLLSSIYNPKRKGGKDSILLPKINKQDNPLHNKFFARTSSRHPLHQNIFKLDQPRLQRGKAPLGREWVGSEEEQLQFLMWELSLRHEEELAAIEQREKQTVAKIEACKKEHYNIKLNIWESKNELMDLHAQMQQEEEEFYRLQDIFAQYEGEYEYREEEGEREGEEEGAGLEIFLPVSHAELGSSDEQA